MRRGASSGFRSAHGIYVIHCGRWNLSAMPTKKPSSFCVIFTRTCRIQPSYGVCAISHAI